MGGCGLPGGRQRAQHAPGSVIHRSSVQFGRAQRTVYIIEDVYYHIHVCIAGDHLFPDQSLE